MACNCNKKKKPRQTAKTVIQTRGAFRQQLKTREAYRRRLQELTKTK